MPSRRKKPVGVKRLLPWCAFLALVLLLLPTAPSAAGRPLVAGLYDDTASPSPSAWALGLDAIDKSLKSDGFVIRRITRDQLNDGRALKGLDVLVIGGGLAFPGYTQGITPVGKTAIREAVCGGMGLVGICAGAYFASHACVYDNVTYGAESGYDLAVYGGAATGPVPTLARYPSYGLATVRFSTHPSYGEGGVRHLWYGGGPYFKNLPPDTQTLATYEIPGVEAHGLAAVIATHLGKGRVVLWGCHSEMSGPGAEPDNPQRFAKVVRWAARL